MGVYFSISALIVVLIFLINFFSKPRIKNIETKIYKYLLIASALGLFLDIYSCMLYKIGIDFNSILYKTISKLVFLYFIIWMSLFTFYIKCISDLKDNHKKSFGVFFAYLMICVILIIIFPLSFKELNGVIIPQGNALFIAYGSIFLMMIYSIYLSIKNRKNIVLKKITPLYAFIIFMIINFIIQLLAPQFFVVNYLLSIIVIIMYFTIENPDVKMIEQLNIAKDQADKANKAKTDFLSSMSHEIRTPLNAIDGFSQLILEEDNIDTIKDEARDIMAASQNLLEIVNGILDISKIEADKLEIINVQYEPAKIFDELVKLTKARIGEKPLELKVNIAKDIPDYLNGDYVRLKQIIVNLLTNAVKYTKEGFVEFKVNCVKKNNICRLIMSVKDTGIGIKKENINKLFTKFERLDKEKNMTIEGTGLGLAITKKLVDLMHGTIVVDSIYGEGSTFTVSLDQKIEDKAKVKVADAKEVSKLNVKGKRVLIVDDNLINLKVAARLLSMYKLETECVSSGFDCLKLFDEGKSFDMVLMDDMMPKMSGVETFKKLQEIDGFNIPVIALTANAITGMKEKYLKDGFNDYISKPIDKKELERVLKTYLN
jgi:signal transduction histidine kinase